MLAMTETGTEWMTRRDVTALLGISRSTFNRWIKLGLLAQYRVDGTQTRRYARHEVTALLERVRGHRVEP